MKAFWVFAISTAMSIALLVAESITVVLCGQPNDTTKLLYAFQGFFAGVSIGAIIVAWLESEKLKS